jgi:hypothetical protein
MPDGTRLNAPSVPGGDDIFTDEISDAGVAQGFKVQGVKLGVGADGEYREISDADPLPTRGAQLDALLQFYEDTSFETGDSPAVLDVNTDLGRDGRETQIINDGPGNIGVEISNDGASFSPSVTLHPGERFLVGDLRIDTIRLTWVTDSAYRVVVV